MLVVRRGRGFTEDGSLATLAGLLAADGWDASCVSRDEALGAGPETVLLLRDSVGFHRVLLDRLSRLPAERRASVVLWQLEPLPPPSGSPFSLDARPLREWAKVALRDERMTDPAHNLELVVRAVGRGLLAGVAASSRGKVEVLAEHGIEASFVPFGGPGEIDEVPPARERDIPVLFLGDARPSRRRRALHALRRAGVELRVVGDWGRGGVWGEERARLLRRTAVLLNLSRHPGDLAGVRLGLGLAHGAVVLSEPLYRPDPFVPGEHYVEAPTGSMALVAKRLLADVDGRERLARAGVELMRVHTLARSAGLLRGVLEAATGPPQ